MEDFFEDFKKSKIGEDPNDTNDSGCHSKDNGNILSLRRPSSLKVLINVGRDIPFEIYITKLSKIPQCHVPESAAPDD